LNHAYGNRCPSLPLFPTTVRKKLTIAALIMACLILLAAGTGYWIVFSPNTPSYEGELRVKLPPGSQLETVADSLESAGVLATRKSFTWMAKLTGWGDQIKAGHYTFKAGVSNYDLLDVLRRGLQTPIHLTLPPGSRPEVVSAVLAREMYFTADDFARALCDTALARELGTDTTHLFGYMMPETYFFYWLNDAPTVVRKIKESFDTFYKKETKDHPAPLGLTPDEVISMAGIVEWESYHLPEKPTVAGVYLNRLRDGWALQADPTIQYAILQSEGKKRRLFFRDYELKHSYNTYLYRGLPPGPINNPSPSSIRAVLQPEAHQYYYFVARGDGTHLFSRTLSEHRRNAQAYYALMREKRKAQE